MARGAYDKTALLAAIAANQWLDEDSELHTPNEFNPYRVSDAGEAATSGLLPYDANVLQQVSDSGKCRVKEG